MRACFAALADGLKADLSTDSDHRLLYEYHAGRIRSIFGNQEDLPLHQDSVGGFLHGFLVTGAHYVPDDTLEQEAMFPVLGGTLLLARDLPPGPADPTAGHLFVHRLAVTVAGIDPAPGTRLVHEAFAIAGDIPLTCATLGGFSLGVAYTHPYLPRHGPDPTTLIAAACHLARTLG
jgi:hypothetical protein